MTSAAFTFDDLLDLAGGRAVADVACPVCGPGRRSPTNQRRKVLRVWTEDGFASYRCARCGAQGYASDRSRRRQVTRQPIANHAGGAERQREQHRRAAWLWGQRHPITGTPAEYYLRSVRGITCGLPPTLAYLPPSKPEHHPALIAAFGIAEEVEPGVLDDIVDGAVFSPIHAAVHLTLLTPNGTKAETEPGKIMIGSPGALPIVIAPANDLLGLAITEGIEDALSAHAATGLGAWAAGSAGRLPGLAPSIPGYVDAVTIYAHEDEAGRNGARGLAAALVRRGVDVFIEGLA